jgi:hypothetical protein
MHSVFLSRTGCNVLTSYVLIILLLSAHVKGKLNLNRLNCEILQVYFEHSIVNDCRLRQ